LGCPERPDWSRCGSVEEKKRLELDEKEWVQRGWWRQQMRRLEKQTVTKAIAVKKWVKERLRRIVWMELAVALDLEKKDGKKAARKKKKAGFGVGALTNEQPNGIAPDERLENGNGTDGLNVSRMEG
jgi:hypothetical protein